MQKLTNGFAIRAWVYEAVYKAETHEEINRARRAVDKAYTMPHPVTGATGIIFSKSEYEELMTQIEVKRQRYGF